ncbi:MAG: ATP-grasp domain-containing protein [Balneolaceae bacterium]|nr:ATP-grasp domain-containing protein [Balneolaceae bacterium]
MRPESKKKIVLLGGSYGQIPAIIEAKKRGLYTILCDYLPDNPGRLLVDEYHCISSTDIEAIAECAEKTGADYILAYASDPAAPAAAFTAEKLRLIGSSYHSVSLLSNKKTFRTFLKNNGFHSPNFVITGDFASPVDLAELKKPWVVKPVDSSDTKGVTDINNENELSNAVQKALRFSKCGQVIVEEYVDAEGANLHGDAFVVNGEMIFCMLGDRIFSSESAPLKPSTELYPSRAPKELIGRVEVEVAEILKKTGFTFGGINIEARVDSKGNVYIMEIGPRAGGTHTPQTIAAATGFNMLKAVFDVFENGSVAQKRTVNRPAICFALHINEWGIFERIDFSERVKKWLLEQHIFVEPGDILKPYSEPGSLIGVLILQFENMNQADEIIPGLYEEVIAGIKYQKQKNTQHSITFIQ